MYCLAVLWASLALAASVRQYEDCADEVGDEIGPFGDPLFLNVTYQGTVLYVLHPASSGQFPVMVFMHGLHGEFHMYEDTLRFYGSHGFVVIFPFIEGPEADKGTVTNTDGTYVLKGIDFAMEANADQASPLHGALDLNNLALNGHSMGATCTIMAAKKSTTIPKVAIAQHPGVCGPFGPPPWPDTWMESDMTAVRAKMPVVMTTATNDNAFWPAPQTASHELGCFTGTKNASAWGHSFFQFSADACTEDGARTPYNDGGHDCPLKVPSPETPVVFTALKLYAQLGGDETSRCFAKLWGADAGSLQKAGTVETAVVVAPGVSVGSLVV
jgi:dienelactone hydrolase